MEFPLPETPDLRRRSIESAEGLKIPRWLEPLSPSHGDSADNVEVFNLFCNFDWGSSDPSLALFDLWPYSLRTMVQMIFATDTPHCIFWGRHLVCIYNAAYWRHIANNKHPNLMGMHAADAFGSTVTGEEKAWNPYQHFSRAIKTRRPIYVPETLWLREGEVGSDQVEEIYTSYRVSTIYGDDCAPAGLLCVYHETTLNVMAARRGRMLRSLISATEDLTTLNALKVKIQSTFNDCGLDFPILLLMLTENFILRHATYEGETADHLEYQTFVQVGMRGTLLSRNVHFDEPISDEIPEGVPMFGALAQRAHKSRGPFTYQTERLASHCLRRAYGHACTTGRMYPLYADESNTDPSIKPFGYMMLCLSPVRPLDTFAIEYANTVSDMIKRSFTNFREVSRSQARLDEMNATRRIGEQYFRVLDDSPAGISLQDWNTQEVIFGNKQWREILGYTEGLALDDWASLVYPEDLPICYEVLSSIKPGDEMEPHLLRLKRLHTNGKPAWVTVNCSFHREQLQDGGVATFLTTAIHDSSEQIYAKEVELAAILENQRLDSARALEAQRADEADCAKARQLDYIDTLAHEIRNPISAIVQTVEVLIDRLNGMELDNHSQTAELQQSIDDLETIDICTTHMSKVINDTLNVSKLEHGSLEVNLQPCDLFLHVESVLRMLQQDMKNKDITCSTISIAESSREAFSRAISDPLRYKQVVLNLMTNAIKFTALQPGSKVITVSLSAEPSREAAGENSLTCSIKDTGRGMSPEAVQKLFGKFYQASERTHIEYGGSGLGLYISQRLAALLGGSIDATSELGIGTTFNFTITSKLSRPEALTRGSFRGSGDVSDLPTTLNEMNLLTQKHSVPAPRSGSRSRKTSTETENIILSPRSDRRSLDNAATTSAPTNRVTDPKQKKTILVVEDNLINQKLMVKQLTLSGYKVLVGNHGQEALDHFKKGERIDLVVTDIEMPVMNGLQTIAAVRALDPSIVDFQPPFIACSAYAREEQRQAFIDAGMIDVIAKPHKFADLKIRVEHVLKHRTPLRREHTV